jgi:hypothetical protein
MLVAREGCAWRYDAVVEIACVMEYGPTARASTYEDCSFFVSGRAVPAVIVKDAEVCLEPWVLVATYDYARSIGVEEQDT